MIRFRSFTISVDLELVHYRNSNMDKSMGGVSDVHTNMNMDMSIRMASGNGLGHRFRLHSIVLATEIGRFLLMA